MLSHMAILCFNILRNCRLFSRMAAPFYIPLSDILGLLFLHFSLTLVIPFFSFSFSLLFFPFSFFDYSHTGGREMVSH